MAVKASQNVTLCSSCKAKHRGKHPDIDLLKKEARKIMAEAINEDKDARRAIEESHDFAYSIIKGCEDGERDVARVFNCVWAEAGNRLSKYCLSLVKKFDISLYFVKRVPAFELWLMSHE